MMRIGAYLFARSERALLGKRCTASDSFSMMISPPLSSRATAAAAAAAAAADCSALSGAVGLVLVA
jgi:hypothetical protein